MVDLDTLIESDGLFMTTLPGGQQFTWRLLTLKEYRVFRALREGGIYNPLVLHNKVFNHCYLGNPATINEMLPAGLFVSIGELIMWLSGDCAGQSDRDDIEIARQTYHNSSVTEVMKRIILIAFSAYKPEELETWTRPRLIKTFTLAEAVLQNRGEYEPINTNKIMSAEEAAKKKSKPPIDFRRENQELRDEFGDRRHPADLHPAELQERNAKTKRLKAQQLRHLDQSMREENKAKERMRRRR